MWDITDKELDELEAQAEKGNFLVPVPPETLLKLVGDLRMWRDCVRADTTHKNTVGFMPCPGCGAGEKEMRIVESPDCIGHPRYAVECGICHVRGPREPYTVKAIREWNALPRAEKPEKPEKQHGETI